MSSRFQLFKDKAGEWRWRLLAENGRSVAASSEGYVARADALNGIDLVRHMRGTTDVYQDKAGEWRWRLTHLNGSIIATSGEGYVARSDCEYGLSLLRKLAPDAPVEDA